MKIDWNAKVEDSKENDKLLGVLFELLLEDYAEHNVSDSEYIKYRDLICYYKDCIAVANERTRLSTLYNLAL